MARTDRNSILTLELVPQGDRADLILDDFIDELTTLKSALRETERLVTGRDPSLFFKINRLQKNSPALVELEAESTTPKDATDRRHASYVVNRFTTNLRIISEQRRLPRRIDVATLDSYREMTEPLKKHGLEVIVKSGQNSIKIDRAFRSAIEEVMGADEIVYGSLTGRIEGMSTHSRNKFRLYPIIGPYRVHGFFKQRDRKKFSSGMDRYVTVWGKIKYKTWDKFPYAIMADDIEVHDEPRTVFGALKGIAPNATGDLSSTDYLNALRDE